ncbi:MAG: hypothetical protein WC052_04575 [Patescibacteria group bacterium]|jgi:predicted esterase YcpF (UPF0227 family)
MYYVICFVVGVTLGYFFDLRIAEVLHKIRRVIVNVRVPKE